MGRGGRGQQGRGDTGAPLSPTPHDHRHSPFRQHKTKDKHEIDRMTLTMVSAGCWASGSARREVGTEGPRGVSSAQSACRCHLRACVCAE